MTSHLDQLMERLREQMGAARVTLRARADGSFPVVSEAIAPGVPRIAGNTTMDPRKGATLRWILEHHRTLVQDDCENAELAPPAELLALYGVKAQVVAPACADDVVVAVVSVHCAELRDWEEWQVHQVELVAKHAAEAL